MTVVTGHTRTAFRQQGFVVVPEVLSAEQIAAGRAVVAAMLIEQPSPAGHAGPYFLWPRFNHDDHALLDFYRQVGLAEVANQLLRPDLSVQDPDFAQLALTIPPWPHRPGGPHVDGITPGEDDGRPGTFTLLAGIWLTDHSQPDQGNLWIWPGTHLRFGRYLAEHGPDALAVDQLGPGPYPALELGPPIQATGTAGSVLFAHYLLAHNIGNHDGDTGDKPRQTVYYRLHAQGHRQRWRQVVTDPLLEFRP